MAAWLALGPFGAVGAVGEQPHAGAAHQVAQRHEPREGLLQLAELLVVVQLLRGQRLARREQPADGPEALQDALRVVEPLDADAEGVVGDLGGSSLELVRLTAGEVGRGATLPLGPFALADARGFDHLGNPIKFLREPAQERLSGRAEALGLELQYLPLAETDPAAKAAMQKTVADIGLVADFQYGSRKLRRGSFSPQGCCSSNPATTFSMA